MKIVFLFFTVSSLFLPVVAPSSITPSPETTFPPGFRWCVATAAHQIEGDNIHSDHWAWETSKSSRVISHELLTNPAAEELLKNAKGPLSPVGIPCPQIPKNSNPTFRFDPLHQIGFQDGSVCEYSGKAVDHWNRLAEDTALLKELNVTDYRFSVEWAKIEPVAGQFDQEALNHYASEVALLVAHGIKPQITLFHFTLPMWLRDRGGWEAPEAPLVFERFTRVVYRALGKHVQTWYTLNEPMIHLSAGYLAGVLPPGPQGLTHMMKALHGILQAHARSYQALHQMAKRAGTQVEVGVAHHLRVFDPLHSPVSYQYLFEKVAAGLVDEIFNWLIPDAIETGKLAFSVSWARKLGLPLPQWLKEWSSPIPGLKHTQDFFGINYYTRDMISLKRPTHLGDLPFEPVVNPVAAVEGAVSDLGWEIYPAGLSRVVLSAKKRMESRGARRIPFFISENGIADRSDLHRKDFLISHLSELSRLTKDGVDVRGYCYWSLTDNYEWNSGYFPRFGLYSVDYNSLARSARPSAAWFSNTARDNGF